MYHHFSQFHCPICKWIGSTWKEVECKPGVFTRKLCPTCSSYPRDRLTWLLLDSLAKRVEPTKLRIIEIGGNPSSYQWKSKDYFYRNADLPSAPSATVHMQVEDGHIVNAPIDFDIGLISYVLSMIEDEATRFNLLSELYRVTNTSAVLIMYDDLLLDRFEHLPVRDSQYFHKLRLGKSILNEIQNAGWIPIVISSVFDTGTLISTELPFICARKR
jgi:hypothetical protein